MKRTRRPGPPVTMPSGFTGFRFPPEALARREPADEPHDPHRRGHPVEAGEGTEEGAINYEVFAAPFADGRLDERVLMISDPATDAREQDPMFSPDGESIVHGAQWPGGIQELWIASVEEPGDRRPVSAADPQFWGVPAWSGR